MLEYLLKKFIPFGVARTMSLAAIPIFQFVVAGFCSKEEAGRFFLISTLAFVASQVGDLGISRALPVLFGDSAKNSDENLSEIILIRWFTGFFLGSLFLFCRGFGPVEWNFDLGMVAFSFCAGRVILLGSQGYRHARQEYGMLLHGAWAHVFAVSAFFLAFAGFKIISTEVALGALAVGVWVELVKIDSSGSHPFKPGLTGDYKKAAVVIFPFASIGILTAIFNRTESFMAGKVLNAVDLGIYGTLDAALKLCIWPSYISAQTLFPAIRDAIEKKSAELLQVAAKKHFVASSVICVVAMLVSFLVWFYQFSSDFKLTTGAALLWFSIWLAVPDSFMIPLFYSFRQEHQFQLRMVWLTVFRVFVAALFGWKFGFPGLCASYFLVTTISVYTLWVKIRVFLQEINSQVD